MRTLVFDLDDTISFTTDRDFANAKPNLELISKINDLSKQGWKIIICTARGSLSCENRIEAEKKYRSEIENWLEKYSVSYDELSFQKHLAQYYVDDKSITPDEFLKLNIKKLNGGLSGALVELRGDKVFKQDKNAINTLKWYNNFKNIVNVPKIYSLIGNEIQMEYIENNSDYNVDVVLNDILKFRLITEPGMPGHNVYKERILEHINHSYEDLKHLIPIVNQGFDRFEAELNYARSVCHGDLSISNILVKNGTHYYIDPIYNKDNYSSYLLDISKLTYSLKLNGDDVNRLYVLKKFEEICHKNSNIPYYKEDVDKFISLIKFLEFLHAIRVYKYASLDLKEKLKELYLK